MTKKITALLLALLMLASLAACGTNEEDPSADAAAKPPQAAQENAPIDSTPVQTGRAPRVTPLGNGEDQITVMIYMCGSDLESDGGAATADINEILYATPSEHVKVILQTGGAKEWQNSVVDADTSQRWLATADGLVLVDDAGQQNMTDPQTLTDFVQYCAENYPANRNILVLWDHGGGTLGGYGSDEHYPDGTMSLSQIDQVLTGANVVFDWIGFDCCMMGTVETAFVAEKHADYLIASQRSEPGGGWYYTDWLNALYENPSLSSPEVGQIIVNSFIREEKSGDFGDELTLSMIDLTAFSPFMDALNAYLSSVNTGLIDTSAYKQVSKARYDSRSPGEEEYDQVDLAYLVNNIALGDGQALLSRLDDTVLISEETAAHYAGLSLYFPYSSIESVQDTLDVAKSIGMSDSYQKFMSDFTSLMAGGQIYHGGGASNPFTETPQNTSALSDSSWLDSDLVSDYASYYAENAYDGASLEIVEKDGQYVLEMSQEDWDVISDVYLEVFLDTGDGYLHLGSDNVAQYNDAGDLIVTFDDNTWVAIDGHIVSFFAEQSQDANVSKGSVPAYVNGDEARLILVWSGENASVAGYERVYDTEVASRGLVPLKDGDTIELIGDFYTHDEEYDDQYVFDTFVISGTPVVSYEDVGEGDCLVYYSLHDIYQNTYWTEPLLYSAQ
jgi:predicted small lipoprotein YifL